MFRNGLITTDGSETARAAFRLAPEVIAPDGRVTVVEVIDDLAMILTHATPAGYGFGGYVSGRAIEDIVVAQRQEAEKHLAAVKQALGEAGLKNVETVILSGHPGDRIVELARQLECDVVVMATHGRGGLGRTVLGSVADHVLRNLQDVPVLLIHPSA